MRDATAAAALFFGALLLAGCGTREAEGVIAPQAVVDPFDWKGDWAASRELCTGGRWHFREGQVSTDGETSCVYRAVDPDGPGRVRITMGCVAEGMATQEEWVLERMSGGQMRVSRATGGLEFVSVTLARCPEAAS